MNIYSIDEYTKEEFEKLMYDRVIVFTLLRSNVYVCIEDGKLSITQQPHLLGYATDSIKTHESEELRAEKGKIEYWARVHKDELVSGLESETIIKDNTIGYNDTLILNTKKPIIIGIEYARKRLLQEIKSKKEETIGMLKNARISSSEYDSYCAMFGVGKLPQGEETIRFYIKLHNDEQATSKVDINIDDKGIVEVIPGSGLIDYEPLKYFCDKYFELIKAHAPLEDIAALDNGSIIDYIPSIFKQYK